jgi:RNA polymerase sigma-70 factor (ECF subfamily)
LEPNELKRFEVIVLPQLDAGYTLARHLAGNDHDAEDIVQEASLRALKYFSGFRGAEPGDARAWWLTIVRNTAYTWQRRQATTLATQFDEDLHSDAAAGDQPAAGLEADTARESLHQALDRLPPEFREVIVLRELEGLSYREIGDVTGVPVGTVMSRLSRARRRLQEALCGQQGG